jgi:hypothetical protein
LPEPLDGLGARFDQQLAVAVAPKVESPEVEPFLIEADDPGLGLVEGQAPRRQPLSQPSLDLFGLLSGVTAGDQIVGVPRQRWAVAGQFSGVAAGSMPDPSGLLQPVQRDVQEQR